MLPPTQVYSTVIHNHTAGEVTVRVTYSNLMHNTSEEHRMTIPAGAKGVAEPRTFIENGTEFAIVITAVHVHNAEAVLTAPFPGVDSPTSNYPINILEEGGGVHLRGGHA
ncbi:hypothetical protein LSCM1_03895 [Leishmania martiniquensis]|uniref:Uncharacterized protein n=1 Tax=Leishmania martiniquensis TaxID=1580590 RepID=A0A836H8T9_9TRYP|nr:hypothetical protein LSCM1_03895 [Leishmania martiniquensis]